jgi:CubicO group peptidase (beta-lactamase class C family)
MLYRTRIESPRSGAPMTTVLWALCLWMLGCGVSVAEDVDLGRAVAAFTDEHFHRGMADSGVPGAVVAVIRGPDVLFLKAYGVSDIATQMPVDPVVTRFRVASLTKAFTALAILRLVDQGVLGLDTDVNTYLRSVKVPPTFSVPVTIQELLRHQGGFDADLSYSDYPISRGSDMRPEEMQRRIHRMRRSGVVASYDNIGFGLLGIVLEDVTGQTFAQVLQRTVFEPLGMLHSTVDMPKVRLPDIARCHVSMGPGRVWPCEERTLSRLTAASGSMLTTGSDMTHFMSMVLQQGEVNGIRFLSPLAFAIFTDPQGFRLHPMLPGIAADLQEVRTATGVSGLTHGGVIYGFISNVTLFPEHGLAVFYSLAGGPPVNYQATLSALPRIVAAQLSPSVQSALGKLDNYANRFAERFIVTPSIPASPPHHKSDAESARRLEGTFYSAREISTNLVMSWYRHTTGTAVRAMPDGSLRIGGDGPYFEMAPLYFENPQTGVGYGFKVTEFGTFMASNRHGSLFGWERLPWFAQPRYCLLPLPFAIVALLTGLVHCRRGSHAARRVPGIVGAVAGVCFLTLLLARAEWGVYVSQVLGGTLRSLTWYGAALVTTLTLVAAPMLMVALRPLERAGNAAYGAISSLHMAVLALASVYCVWFSIYWKVFT